MFEQSKQEFLSDAINYFRGSNQRENYILNTEINTGKCWPLWAKSSKVFTNWQFSSCQLTWHVGVMWIDKHVRPEIALTSKSSFLSALLAITSPITYNPNTTQTKDRTTKFPVSPSLPNSAKTLSKSMGFGATNKSPPNAERWLQRQWSLAGVALPPSLSWRKEQDGDLTRIRFQMFIYLLPVPW